MIKLVTLDLDNTLWDAPPVLRQAEQAMTEWLYQHVPALRPRLDTRNWMEFRREVLSQQPALRHRVSALRKQVLRQVMVSVGLSPGEADALAHQAFEVFWQARQKVVLFDQAEPMLDALHRRYCLISLTNGNASIEQIGLARYFHHHLCAEDVGVSKPDPLIFRQALVLAGVAPEESVHIGDHLVDDVQGARAAGMHAVWFNPQRTPADRPVRWQVAGLSEIEPLLSTIESTG